MSQTRRPLSPDEPLPVGFARPALEGAPRASERMTARVAERAVEPRAIYNGPDRRGAPRTRTLKQARVSFAGGAFSVEATVRNVSPLGVKLSFAHGVTLPDLVELTLAPGEPSRMAAVVWIRELEAGLKFI
ncbi:MAG: PilZ domain-containing protein [Alphaproteobacteria bacterium]|jgi:hypothetical protein